MKAGCIQVQLVPEPEVSLEQELHSSWLHTGGTVMIVDNRKHSKIKSSKKAGCTSLKLKLKKKKKAHLVVPGTAG